MNQSIATKIADYFATKPVVRAYIFGSFARGENGPDSDIDILVTFDRSAKVSLFDHVSMTYDLEDLLGMDVDLVTEGTLLPRVAASAENDKVLIYEIADAKLHRDDVDLHAWLEGFHDTEKSVRDTVAIIKNHPLMPATGELTEVNS